MACLRIHVMRVQTLLFFIISAFFLPCPQSLALEVVIRTRTQYFFLRVTLNERLNLHTLSPYLRQSAQHIRSQTLRFRKTAKIML